MAEEKLFVANLLNLPAFQEIDGAPLTSEEEKEIDEEIKKINPRKLLAEYILNLPAFREQEDTEELKQ